MKAETFKGTVEQAYGEPLAGKLPNGANSLTVEGSYQAYETVDEVRKANDWPSDDEILKVVNAKRKAAARAARTIEVLEAAGISKPDPNTPENRRKRMIADFVAMGVPQNIAEQQVDAIVAAAKS